MRLSFSKIILLVIFALSLAFPVDAAPPWVSPDITQYRDGSGKVPVIIRFRRTFNPGARRISRLGRAGLIRILKDELRTSQRGVLDFLQRRGISKVKELWIINGIRVKIPENLIKELSGIPGIESIEPDRKIRRPGTIVAQAALPEWNISMINAPDLWKLGYDGTGVVVANMDTGVDLFHQDLQTRWRGGADSWCNPFSDPLNSDLCASPGNCSSCELSGTPCDTDGHGTMTMGIMVGGDLGGSAIGVAPGATWMGAKIFNDAGDSWDSIIHEAFQCILDPDGDPLTDDAPDVLNNSWGIDVPGVCFTDFQDDVDILKAAGVAVVFSAGNSGPSGSTDLSPGNNSNNYAVGAVDSFMNIANFSSRGPSACDGSIFPEVVAPGVSIRSAYLTSGGLFPDSYALGSGTSFAAPHVAGAMALLIGAFPGVTPSELERVLEGTALDLGDACPDNSYGYGLIDLGRAYDTLLNAEPLISVQTCSHDFGVKGLGKTFPLKTVAVTNLGKGPLNISGVSLGGQDPGDFQVQNDVCSGQALSPGASCSFDLEYAPLAGGASSALAVIQSDDPSNPSFEISLAGGAIELVSPNGGESIPSGAVHQIQWLSPSQAEKSILRYSCDGGTSWSVIAGNVSGTTYDWQMPVYGTDMSQCLVRVTAFDASGTKLGRDDSDDFFTIRAASVMVTSPNGGESLPSGGNHLIQWTAPPNGSEFTLRYTCDSGATWTIIAKKVPGTSYSWAVPVFSGNKNQCLVRVTAFDSLGVKLGRDESDGTFGIEVVRVTSPNGGEVITGGGQHTVTWVTNGTVSSVAKVVIRYSTDSGATWVTAGKVSGNPGSFLWNVPSITSTTVRVKVALKDASNSVIGRDRSDADFEIQ